MKSKPRPVGVEAPAMSDDLLRPALDTFAQGDLQGAVDMLDALRGEHRGVAAVHHTFAEFANMLNMEAQEDLVPGGKIMMAYKKAMELDEENDEYIADFADFALECNRIPVAVKEFKRYATRLEMADIPYDDRLYPHETSSTASRSSIQSGPPTSVSHGSSKPCSGPSVAWVSALKTSRACLRTLEVVERWANSSIWPCGWVTSAMPFTAAKSSLTW